MTMVKILLSDVRIFSKDFHKNFESFINTPPFNSARSQKPSYFGEFKTI